MARAAFEAEQEGVLRPIADVYTRHRRLLLFIAVGYLLLGFNGQWIVERDTSMYRGLGHTLATGQGYTFGEFASKVIYPGLPLILAGLEITFGETALPAILLMNAMALATLWLTYRLVRLYFAEWMAVAVTVGVALNAGFARVAQEIMTDIPFLLGVVAFLYGWERLKLAILAPSPGTPACDELSRVGEGGGESDVERRGPSAAQNHPHPDLLPEYREKGSNNSRPLWASLAYLVPGLLLALSMRPTFWILAMAWGLVCLWGLIRGPRKFYATCLLLVFAVGVAFFFLDPRTRGFNPLGGGYEIWFLEKLTRVRATVAANLPAFFGRQFSAGFFGGRFGFPFTHVITAAVVGSTYSLFRRGLVLWGLLVVCTIGVTMLVEVVPRYYLMILPVMMVAYVLLWRALANRTGATWGPAVFVAGVALLLVPNLIRGAKFIYEQHWDDPGRRKKWAWSIVSAEMIRENVPEGSAAVAPGATIVSYLSGRDVYMAREIFPEDAEAIDYPRNLKAKGIEYAIWPPMKMRDQEGLIAELMDKGVIVPTGVVTREMGLTLATVEIVIPPEGVDWRDNPVVEYGWVSTTRGGGPTSDQIRRQQRLRREQYEARVRREKNELREKLEARRAREARAAREAREARERMEVRKRYEQRLAREARERQAANARRLKRLREQAATQQSTTTQPTTRPATGPSPPAR